MQDQLAALDAELADVEAEVVADEAAATEAPTPCFECDCCTLWTERLGILAAHIRSHTAGERRRKACHPGCLVCAEVGWQS